MRVCGGSEPSLLFTIGTANRGGAEGQLVRLAAGLNAKGYRVRVLFLASGGELTSVLDEAGVHWRVARLPLRKISRLGRDLIMALRIAFFLVRWRPRIVMAWLPGAIWPTLILAAVFSRARRVAALRGETLQVSRRVRALLQFAVRRADLVTVNAHALVSEAAALGAEPQRVAYIPNGVDIPADSAPNVESNPPVAVVVANYRWYKGHDVLIRALADVKAPLIVRLLGEGDGGRTAVSALADELGVRSRVTFVPYPAAVAEELRSAQFAIHPSRTEGLSNAILEELAAGLPVVATEVGGTATLIEDGEEGLLVRPGDHSALASAIERVASDPSLRRKMSQAARRRAEQFSWAVCLREYEKVFHNVAPAMPLPDSVE